MNIGSDEGTVAELGDPSFYLPGGLASEYGTGPKVGRIIRIDYRDEDGWRTDPVDSYQKTNQPIPIDRISAVTMPIVKEDGRYIDPPYVNDVFKGEDMGDLGPVEAVVYHDGPDTDDSEEDIDAENEAWDRVMERQEAQERERIHLGG